MRTFDFCQLDLKCTAVVSVTSVQGTSAVRYTRQLNSNQDDFTQGFIFSDRVSKQQLPCFSKETEAIQLPQKKDKAGQFRTGHSFQDLPAMFHGKIGSHFSKSETLHGSQRSVTVSLLVPKDHLFDFDNRVHRKRPRKSLAVHPKMDGIYGCSSQQK